MTRFLVRISVLAVGLAMTATAAFATPITYSVSRTMAGGSVAGSIVTDGTIGVLATANVIGWTLLLNDGSTTFTLQGPLTGNNSSVLVLLNSFTASLTGLFFDFSATGFALFQNPVIGSAMNAFCMEGPAIVCAGFGAGETLLINEPLYQFASRTGVIQVGSVQAAAVPEPASLVLVGLGFAALAGRRLVRKH